MPSLTIVRRRLAACMAIDGTLPCGEHRLEGIFL
eukprot:CAMPEP_0115222578 /NCGR_PEP_ID=MMETSP0270-20121206/28585_1 /TAXON_ID=71861 /ORGANISM="Scrippsiella trochoidea, Strain CCMP3099" /LENGTH=33 /DNA_ID= /DNA_START= /DNA_END= /DNA_ORIENTATION=